MRQERKGRKKEEEKRNLTFSVKRANIKPTTRKGREKKKKKKELDFIGMQREYERNTERKKGRKKEGLDFSGKQSEYQANKHRKEEEKMLKEKAIRTLKENAVFTEMDNKPSCHWSAGEGMAYKAWRGSVYQKQSELELEDRLLKEEVHDFIATLRRAEIKSFVFSGTETYSTWFRGESPWWNRVDRGIAEHLQDFEAEGCRIGHPCTIERNLICAERIGAGIRIWL